MACVGSSGVSSDAPPPHTHTRLAAARSRYDLVMRERRALAAEKKIAAAVAARQRWQRENRGKKVVAAAALEADTRVQTAEAGADGAAAAGSQAGGSAYGGGEYVAGCLCGTLRCAVAPCHTGCAAFTHACLCAVLAGAMSLCARRCARGGDDGEDVAEEVVVASAQAKERHPFKGCIVAPNGAALWGKSVVKVALSDSTAFALTSMGTIEVWGGHNKVWRVLGVNVIAQARRPHTSATLCYCVCSGGINPKSRSTHQSRTMTPRPTPCRVVQQRPAAPTAATATTPRPHVQVARVAW